MPGAIVQAGNVLAAGIRATFWDIYQTSYNGIKEKLKNCMEFGIPSDKLTEIYAYFESSPYPRLWRRGEAITSKPFGSRQFTVTNRAWGGKVEWHEEDREDDQLQKLYQQAQLLGAHWGTLDERIFFQLLTGATDPLLLPAIPTAPDGANLYATTAGGAARFGVTNGNLLTGGGVATPLAIQTDVFTCISRFLRFQDTEGQPLLDAGILDRGYTLFYNPLNVENVTKAFQNNLVAIGANTATSNAAIDNALRVGGHKVEPVATQRITDNDMFLFVNGIPRKPIFQQERRPMRSVIATMENSDVARATKIESVQFDSRAGYGLLVPYGTIEINN